MDSTSPEGGYAGLESELEAARGAMNEDLPAPTQEPETDEAAESEK